MLKIWQYFLNLQPKIPKHGTFGQKIVCCAQFFAFPQIPIFCLKIPKRTFLVTNLRIFVFARNIFKLTTQNYTNKAFLVPKLKLFVLNDLPFHKFEPSGIRIPNVRIFLVYDFSLWYRKKEYFFVSNIKIIIFARNFALWLIHRCWFQIWR